MARDLSLQLDRLTSNKDRTLGVLYAGAQFCCFALEDIGRDRKVAGETRIPRGRYEVKIRTTGKWPARNAAKWGWHGRRSLEICGVPGFTCILFHTGNDKRHTEGCVLLGLGVAPPDRITHSRPAYARLANVVLAALDAGRRVWLAVTDPAEEQAVPDRP